MSSNNQAVTSGAHITLTFVCLVLVLVIVMGLREMTKEMARMSDLIELQHKDQPTEPTPQEPTTTLQLPRVR